VVEELIGNEIEGGPDKETTAVGGDATVTVADLEIVPPGPLQSNEYIIVAGPFRVPVDFEPLVPEAVQLPELLPLQEVALDDDQDIVEDPP
jgi:hypothetical protein